MGKLQLTMTAFVSLILMSGCQSQEKEPKFTLRIAAEDDPQSLDPRLARNLTTVTTVRMLFDGLMTLDAEGSARPGIARAVSISPNQKRFTFYLRDSRWSDGTPVTAEDFVETWRSVLSPEFPAPNAYQLFVIKNAKAVKEGKAPTDQLGVWAEDPQTLIVELESPTPYFLKLVATHFFFPVHHSLRQTGYGEIDHANNGVIGNGPFQLKRWNHSYQLLAVKNPLYWDHSKVKLDGIRLAIQETNTAIQLFETGQLDWVGSPMSTLPQDAVQTLKDQGRLKLAPAAGVYWLRVNTRAAPFQDVKIRQAFALAVNRQALVNHVTQGGQQPARGIVPPTYFGPGELKNFHFADGDLPHAQTLFLEAAAESNEPLPSISISYSLNDRNHKLAQALQQQWEELFAISVRLQGLESKLFQSQLARGDYQLALGSWFADFPDPLNFLEIFKYRTNATNSTGWESPGYIQLLDQSAFESNQQKRLMILREAEKMLMEQMPVIPLFINTFNFLTKPEINGVIFSELGYLDFKQAEITP